MKCKLKEIIIYTVLIVLTLIYILPLLWMINVSLKTNQELMVKSVQHTGSPAAGQLYLCMG